MSLLIHPHVTANLQNTKIYFKEYGFQISVDPIEFYCIPYSKNIFFLTIFKYKNI